MTEECNLENLSNEFKSLKVVTSNTHQNGLNTISTEEIDNQIEKITGKQIIEKLNVLDNNLNHVSNISVEYLSHLVDLNLYNCRLKYLPNSLNMLKALNCLNLDDNQFYVLPSVICELTNLKKLWACRNKIAKVPSNLGDLSNLEILFLSTNQLTDLPMSCANLNRLEVCCLCTNKFQRIPDCIAKGMRNLQILMVSQNPYMELNIYPQSINLKSFYAEQNHICPSFPVWILNAKYTKLETVVLNDTRFKTFNFRQKSWVSYVKKLMMKQCNLQEKEIEKIISGTTKLEQLVIGNGKTNNQNYFPNMPIKTMQDASSLKQIDMHDTGLVVIPNTINKFVNLSDMNLSSNNIFFLPEEICCLKSLSRLIMDNNHIASLPQNIGDLISLRELKIRNNDLNRLPDSMKSLSNLEYLDLYDNELETVPEMIADLASLKGLDLEQNFFSTKYLSPTRVPYYENMRDVLRNYWLDSLFGYESLCGCKPKPFNNELSSSPSSSLSKSNLSDEEGVYSTIPGGTYNELMNERWDTSEDSAEEFDPHEHKEPRKRMYHPFTFYKPFQQEYCPAESHPPRVITRVIELLRNGTLVWTTNFEEGQFEDP
ncbi:unnamed protein product [Xylocopa violacea]|uniref:Disease resistance R13L4/SHOC-2-like LRR domain-containing protein n=1 Tax=Xylocopa violacea TaxID=135666 RepID=A0ABP1N501_XYLVO